MSKENPVDNLKFVIEKITSSIATISQACINLESRIRALEETGHQDNTIKFNDLDSRLKSIEDKFPKH